MPTRNPSDESTQRYGVFVSPSGRGGALPVAVRALSLAPAPSPGPRAAGDAAQTHSRHSSPAPLMVNGLPTQ